MDTVKVVELIETTLFRRGEGTKESPIRVVEQVGKHKVRRSQLNLAVFHLGEAGYEVTGFLVIRAKMIVTNGDQDNLDKAKAKVIDEIVGCMRKSEVEVVRLTK